MRWVRRSILLAAFVGMLVLGWGFASENADLTTVHLVVTEFIDVPVWRVVLAAFGAGVALAGIVGVYQVAKSKLVMRRYRRTAHELEAEVHQLRNLPLAADGEATPGDPIAELRAEALPGDALERGA
jgi:uncharacterized integral membrane protein